MPLEKAKSMDSKKYKAIERRRKSDLMEIENYQFETPEPPKLEQVSHYTIELSWLHVKEKLPRLHRFKFIVQETSKITNNAWVNIYSGYGIIKSLNGRQPVTEYNYRLCVVNELNERSEYSKSLTVRTTKEPLTGEELHAAIATENIPEVTRILNSENGNHIMNIPDKFGNSPMITAVNRNNIEILQILIDHQADVNTQSETGKTPLMMAAFAGKLNLIKTLRSNGAKYHLRDNPGSSVLHYAVDGGNLTAIRWILMDGHEVDPVDKSGWTPLLRACSIDGSVQVISILLKFKANLHVVDNEKLNAITVAILNNNMNLIKLLTENGSNFMAPNDSGKTPYELAVSMEKKAIVAYFDEILEKKKDKRF